MSDASQYEAIVGEFISTAQAHHAATGGDNPHWARWYAEKLGEPLGQTLDSKIDVNRLETWLIDADVRYRSEEQTESWPKAYAKWMLSGYEQLLSTEPGAPSNP